MFLQIDSICLVFVKTGENMGTKKLKNVSRGELIFIST